MRINWPCKKIVTTSGEAPNGYRARVTYIEIMRAGCGCRATSPIPFDELRTAATIEFGRSGRFPPSVCLHDPCWPEISYCYSSYHRRAILGFASKRVRP
jgi:hypothetical protein